MARKRPSRGDAPGGFGRGSKGGRRPAVERRVRQDPEITLTALEGQLAVVGAQISIRRMKGESTENLERELRDIQRRMNELLEIETGE